MVVLNWKAGLGNVTLQPGTSILVPFQTSLASLLPFPIPALSVAQPDEYGIYFLVESIDATTNAVTFKKDSDGFKIPLGYTSYQPTNTASTPPTVDDYLLAIGYPPGVLPGGVYSNALNLTTIRLGDGNDVFTLGGRGITQSLSAVVNKEASQGYIFQSNIFAGAGDDLVVALMPWQSVFKGGTNTAYRDAINDPSGAGVAITLNDSLTLEEVPFGDTIELKGSRFDWDIEFRDGNGDGSVTLASILNESDYIATSNNNRIFGFERILFGDILFDLVLYRQLESSVVYGQPDYFLTGSEPQAPELNSDIASGSNLWEAFRFNRTKIQGISGTATNATDVFTGDANDTPFLVGALRFASLNTEAGNDIVEIGSADQATVDLGSGADQLKVNGAFSRASVLGGEGDDNIILSTVSNSSIFGGAGRDIVEVTTATTDTAFDGGGDSGDTLLLPGTFAAFGLTSSNTGGVVTFTDGSGNSFTGFQSIKFSDINLDALQTLSLTGPAAALEEGSEAIYTIALSGSGLANGESVAFSLQLGNGTAQFSSDLAALILSSLQASAGIVLRNVSVDAGTGLIRAVASASRAFSAAAPIATLALPVTVDLLTEPDETFTVTLTDFVQSQTATTTISNVLPVTIRLDGPATATEGSTADFSVVLDGVGLAAGRSVTFSLNSAGGTATEGSDFAALLATALQKADGLQLSGISTAADGTVTVTATNISGAALAAGATLLTVQLPITTDATVEGNETFGVTLASSTAVVSSGVVTTTISDLVPTPTIALSGEASVVEGQSAAYAVSLAGTDLLAGQSITFRLDTAGGTAIEGMDFAALVASGITAGPGITLSSISTDPVTKAITLTATNTSGGSLAAGSQLVSFSVATTADAIAEADETFNVSLTSADATVSSGAGTIASTITDGNTAVVKLTGPAVVEEGSAALYAVSLDGVDLGNGQSVTLTLDLASGSATEGLDFAALLGADLKPAAGVTFSPISFDPVSGALSLTVTNNSGGALASGSPLLTFSVATIADGIVEANETFSVSLSSNDATVSTGTVPTTITETGATTAIKLTGSATVAEGDSASYAVSLDAVGLGAGRSVNIRLFSLSGTANQGADFAPLLASGLTAAAGVTLSGISTSSLGTVSVTATNTSGADLAINAELLSFLIRTNADAVAELDETYELILGSTDAAVGTASFTTTITDSTSAAIRLTGPTTVAEGSAAGYGVSLAGGAALGVGRSVTFTLDSAGITATEGRDFAALLAANIKPTAPGISLTGFTTGADGAVTLTATNTSLLDLEAGSQLLSFDLLTTADVIDEADETLIVSLTSSSPILGPNSITTTITDNDAAVIKLTAAAPPLITEGRSANYVVSLDGVVLGAGGSVTFTLDTSSGTAIEGIDFAALTPGALQPGPGLTLGGFITGPVTKSPPLLFVTDPITRAVTVTVTNTSGADLAAGSQLVGFTVTSLADSVVENSEYFGLSLTSSTATVSGEPFLMSVIKDSRSSFQEPGAFDSIRSIDNVALGSNLFGYALQVGSGGPIQITYSGSNASPTSPGAGWQAIAAAADGSGFDLFFKHSNGTFALWNLNGAGAFMSGRVLSMAEVLTAESRLGADLNGDQQAGFSFSPSRTIGSVALGTTQLGYGLQVGAAPGAKLAAGSPIQITYAGISASPSSPGAGWRAIAAAADGSGFDLFFKNTSGSYALWNLDGAGAFTSGQVLSSAELLAAESKHASDLNGDRQTGFTFNPSRTIGSVTFGSTQLGYGLKVGAGSPIQITYDGISASPTSPGAGWTAIGAAADGSGFDLYFKNINGSRALWNLDAAGAFTSGQLLTSAEFLAAESNLQTDLDDDQQTGFSFTPSRTIGTVTFGSTQLGYGLKVGAGSPIQITYAGINASPTSPGEGWSAIGAVADGSGFDLYLKNTNGSYGLWNLDATGVFTSGKILSTPELLQAEVANGEDLSGDGRIGPFAFRGGGSQADVLTGLVGGATFGFAEADTLTSASPSASGFDILLGGSGNDAYQLPTGRSTLVVENGADPADSLTALGLSLHGATTKLTTLERGRHLVLSDTASNTRLYLYDWRRAGNRIETFQFADGSFTFQQVQQKLTSLGASVSDTTWASWDSQFGNGQLTSVGLASGAAMDNLISFYRSVDASGVLA